MTSFHTGGGGGWGNPFERDPELVRHDVDEEFISRADAERSYGVVLRDDLGIDVAATQQRRTQQKASRGG